MNILPINNNPNFNGRIIKKGHWTNDLNTVFENNPEVQKLRQRKRNIIAHMSNSKKKYSPCCRLEDVYKLTLTSVPPQPTLWDKIKLFFGCMPSISLTRHYHREFSTENLIRWNIDSKTFAEKLKLNN